MLNKLRNNIIQVVNVAGQWHSASDIKDILYEIANEVEQRANEEEEQANSPAQTDTSQ